MFLGRIGGSKVLLMAPIATEAIAARVWKKLGLTQAEIDSFYVAPALLPWQRMGNIQDVGGTLPQQWHEDQIVLQHQVLKRMKELGMQPIVQSFAGFVPGAIKRIYPNLKLHNTLWNAGFAPSKRPVMLMPEDPLFKKITMMYMEEWQKEFGSAKYYLVDSFNELELPKSDQPITQLLADYGKFTFDAIQEANKDAVWVIQGWMFGYQRKQWPPQNVKALFSKVPDNKILILDYANDYANTWEPLNAFDGKQWVYGFLPNAGGKTAYTGPMELYATGASKTMASSKKNNLVGFSISGEGLENNNVVYELLTDVAWSKDPIELNFWFKDFSVNRYGAYPDSLKKSWELLKKSAYSYLIDHPSFNWQQANFGTSNIDKSSDFLKSVDLFLSCRRQLGKSKNYQADAIERSGLVLGLKAANCFQEAGQAFQKGDAITGEKYGAKGLEILTALDRLMESHPLNRLERWVGFASALTKDKDLKRYYEQSARRIVTVWGLLLMIIPAGSGVA
ncbi:alpha-N-acetylglucosaminidase TIM-barrel domain-containing protein [Pedobacter roseus]|uniref:Alpha-N-acetylglucosaminidase C-terminal domain-containing protein n=1 Tax=Pedobacter roseus TaxID=336820 RepID=A0A7G9QBU6_9SPHI|nr:alpha-N-acetylglucosaminidase TIM-barrel domain-containing protein [Pedobacter roseus]QNN40821.1 alpha-N-acetylglucosaminidase C-terminal domain-containing protein [Pedobacter roseus]